METHRKRIRWSWIILGTLGAVFFVLGYLGFREVFADAGEARSVADGIYLTIQLFTMESGAVDGIMPWKLEIARFGAPLLTASAIIGGILSLFSVEIRRLGLRLRGGHVIVCGLGRKGSRLVEELCKAGDRVVVIEPNEHNPALSRCHELKVIVIHGRADEEWNLQRACLPKARRLIATTGDDGVNIEIVIRAERLLRQSGSSQDWKYHFVAHISDPALQHLIKRHQIFQGANVNVDLAIANVYEVGARLLLERSGLFENSIGSEKIRVGLVGLGTFGEAVLRRLLRDVWLKCRLGDKFSAELEIVIVDGEASRKETSFRMLYRDFLEGVTLQFVDGDVRSPEFSGSTLSASNSDEPFSVFFVCFDDDSLATLASLRIRDRFGPELPIVIRMAEEFGFANLLREDGAPGDAMNEMHPIGFLDMACIRDLFLGGDREVIARALHDDYVNSCRAAGLSIEDKPNSVPWNELDEPTRESNRSRADSLRGLLKNARLELVACPDRAIHLYELRDAVVDQLARQEHVRWCRDLEAGGWRPGESTIKEKKIHSLLKDWEALSDDDKEYNRVTSRNLPVVLAKADFEIVEMKKTQESEVKASINGER